MSKFKVGDRVRCVDSSGASPRLINGREYTISHSEFSFVGVDDETRGEWLSSRFELVTEGAEMEKPYERKTYKLLKETAELSKNALVQEKCDDGDQDFVVLDETFVKYANESGNKRYTLPRPAVEQEPTWFVQVFKVHPEYMTREELDKWEEFRTGKTPKAVKKPVKIGRRVMSDERLKKFVQVHNSSRTIETVAKKMGISVGAAYVYKSYAKRTGADLKSMK